jgi:hypothetical protein
MASPRICMEIVDEIAAPNDEYAFLAQGCKPFADLKME